MIQFTIVQKSASVPGQGRNAAFLQIDNWDDFSFKTMFFVTLFDEHARKHELGNVKIGFVGQPQGTSTRSTLEPIFGALDSRYFSVGMDVEYYICLFSQVSISFRNEYLDALRDVVHSPETLDLAQGEQVFQTSHLRALSMTTITNQFRRILGGGAALTDYNFLFTQNASDRIAGYQLGFKVFANSAPPTNIHAIIGRNGVGKTMLLNNMTRAITEADFAAGRFETFRWSEYELIKTDYFSGFISVSFSAFDSFTPPTEQPDPTKGTCYFYVGLKSRDHGQNTTIRSSAALVDELVESLAICLSEQFRGQRWLDAVHDLETDDNFAEMDLSQLYDLRNEELHKRASDLLRNMSSGHAIVFFTITKLVARLDEKTLVVFDEPESHLHPPLLSALVRSLSKLLSNRNAVAIVATHSPVVLQEIPKSCVWKITRSGVASQSKRPEIETFGENVGVLTREIFGLEVAKSGFNALLTAQADQAESYEEALDAFSDQLGFEGRAILRSIMHRTKPE